MAVFKFNKANIQDVCRGIKQETNGNVKKKLHTELDIMYDNKSSRFFYCHTHYTQFFINNGNYLYCRFHHSPSGGRVTIKHLMEETFKNGICYYNKRTFGWGIVEPSKLDR